MEKNFLIVAENTSAMLLIDKKLKDCHIQTDLVPAPPESGTVCAIAVKILQNNLEKAKETLEKANIKYKGIYEDKNLTITGLIDSNLDNYVSVEFIEILKKVETGDTLNVEDTEYLLSTSNKKEEEIIYVTADNIRREIVGDIVDVRGAIEFSNYCNKSCKYCGISYKNKNVKRYRMNEDEILKVVHQLKEIGIKTVILQSGEDPLWDVPRITALIKRIKQETAMKITLSVGERTREEYETLKNAGANNYLLKIETTNRDLFKKIHPDDDYDYRLECSKWLKQLGYLNGSGNILGLPGQTITDIANDIVFFKEMGINMIGIGPFVPAVGSEFENEKSGDVDLTLRTVAVTRIVCQRVYIPSTTALATLDPEAQVKALQSGANTVMLINTPPEYREKYNIYDNKNVVDLKVAFDAIMKAGRIFPPDIKIDSSVIG